MKEFSVKVRRVHTNVKMERFLRMSIYDVKIKGNFLLGFFFFSKSLLVLLEFFAFLEGEKMCSSVKDSVF